MDSDGSSVFLFCPLTYLAAFVVFRVALLGILVAWLWYAVVRVAVITESWRMHPFRLPHPSSWRLRMTESVTNRH